MNLTFVYKGGKGFGNFGHSGRPGKVGGSGSGGGGVGSAVGGGGNANPNYLSQADRVWQGTKHEEKRQLTNNQTGKIGEDMAERALEDELGFPFTGLNVNRSNAPIDLAGDHKAVEVKAGPASNGKSAQQWRATISTEGKAERELVRMMSQTEKRAYNQFKQQQVFARKNAMVAQMSEIANANINPMTVGVILSPDGKLGDVFFIDGFHARIGWNKGATEANYVGTYKINNPEDFK